MVRNFFQTLRTENPDTKIGVAGFCWGGRYALLLGQKSFAEKPLVDAVFAGHPSMMALPADVEGLVVPASIAAGTMDYMFSPKMVTRTKEVWKDVDVETEIITYEAKHGFCVRGNMNNEKEKKVMDEAIEQVFPFKVVLKLGGQLV
jgi:dienelactone hydrolase